LITFLPASGAYSSVLKDPGIADGEQIIWRGITPDGREILSTVTWHVKERDGKPIYEIITDSGEIKQGKYILEKSDLQLVWLHISEDMGEGISDVVIDVKGDKQYLTYNFKGKREERDTKHHADGYNGLILGFCLRGFPFGKQEEVKMRITPPFGPNMPGWAWKMWKAYAKVVGEEKVTVTAGTFDCYKLEIAASGGLIRLFTSEYYFWFAKESPHCFVKYQDKDGKSMTELIEIKIDSK
jgi:hypothetical protein